MSDSSEEEDLSRFREAVDSSFTKLINETRGAPKQEENNLPSERYLETSSHYNDVKVPEKMQIQIGTKISKIIDKNVEFVDVDSNGVKKRKIKGGVKLFSTSQDYLTPEVAVDKYAETHNAQAKKRKLKRRLVDEEPQIDDNEKAAAVAVTGDYVLSREETKCWKSRRKEKLFKYKGQKNSKVLTAIE